jgi:hypothetical protein
MCPMIQGHQACLTWHMKGHCWDHCDKSLSHVKLSDAEKASLVTFLKEGLNSIEQRAHLSTNAWSACPDLAGHSQRYHVHRKRIVQ